METCKRCNGHKIIVIRYKGKQCVHPCVYCKGIGKVEFN